MSERCENCGERVCPHGQCTNCDDACDDCWEKEMWDCEKQVDTKQP